MLSRSLCALSLAVALTIALASSPGPAWALDGETLALASVDVAGAPAAAPVRVANLATPGVGGIPMPEVGSDGMSRGMQPPERLKLNLEGRDIVTIYATGQVELADGLTMDEASREFWKKIGQLAPSFCAQRAAR